MRQRSSGAKVWLIIGIVLACLAVVVVGLGIFGFLFYFKTAQSRRAFPRTQQPITITPQPDRPLSPQNNFRPKVNVPKVTTDPLAAEIPDAPVSGTFGGKDFQIDQASINSVTFELKQGPDSIIFFLFLKQGEKLDGRKFVVAGKPPPGTNLHIHVHRQGVTFPMGALTENYALRLEFGERQGDKLPGKIFLELPKSFDTKIAGTFEATLPK